MEAMLIAASDLVALLSPSRIEALADRVRGSMSAERDGNLYQLVTTPTARLALDRLIAAWRQTEIPGDVLAGILVGAAYARQQAQRESIRRTRLDRSDDTLRRHPSHRAGASRSHRSRAK